MAKCPGCELDKPRASFGKHKLCSACRAAGIVEPVPEPVLLEAEPEVRTPEVFPVTEANYEDPTMVELAARTLARRRLLPFIKRFRPKYLAGWVHEDICRRLERFLIAVENQESPRLVLMMPVRMGKSEIGSRHFAPFALGKHPEWEIIAASGGQNLAMTFSRYIRDLMRDPGYKALFPNTVLDPQSQSVENWSTTQGGGYMAAGVGTMIVGRGAHILLIDDPCTSPEAADSQTQRDAVWEWYIGAAINRLSPGGGVLGIMTHWNEDDWAGRVQQLSAMDGDSDKFEIVKYPAVNDQGDEYMLADDTILQLPEGSEIPEGARMTRPMNTALHPERYTMKMLMNTKATYYGLGNQRWWSALYQQNPSPEEGAYFTKKMFRTYAHEVSRYQRTVFQAWDFAISENRQNDWTVGCTILQDENDNLFVLDVNRFRSGDGIDIMSTVVKYAKDWSPDLVGFEDGQIWKSLESTFAKTCEAQGIYPSYEVLKPLTDKLVRAQPLRGRMQAGKLWWPEKAPWYETTRAEFLRFNSGGKHDDIVDSIAWCVRLTLSRAAPRLPAPPKIKGWRDKLKGVGRGSESHMAA